MKNVNIAEIQRKLWERSLIMKEVDQATRENLLIVSYWPGQAADEPNIGYGFPKEVFIVEGFNRIFSLCTSIFIWFFAPRIRPLVHPAIRFIVAIAYVATAIPLSRRNMATNKQRGYYQLDGQGQPVIFISRMQPESIDRRIGVGRNRFLVQVSERG